MKRKIKFVKLSLLPLLGVLMTSCNANSNPNAIYTSFYPVYDFASRIVGDKYEVINLLPPGVEPHDFELSAKAVSGLIEGKATFINGLGMEHWYDSLPKVAKDKVYDTSLGIKTRLENGIVDPHIWLNPINAIKQMENITSYLCSIDEENSSLYLTNFKNESAKFAALDIELSALADTLTNKYIVTSHAAFGYMCDRYGLKQISIKGLEPDEEPSAKTMQEIIETMKEYNINTIFIEEMVSKEIANKIAEETGAKIEVLNPLEGLDSDRVGIDDYISVMKDNFKKIEESNK